jgi:hypothetical protein
MTGAHQSYLTRRRVRACAYVSLLHCCAEGKNAVKCMNNTYLRRNTFEKKFLLRNRNFCCAMVFGMGGLLRISVAPSLLPPLRSCDKGSLYRRLEGRKKR